jgi:hypothetical protein
MTIQPTVPPVTEFTLPGVQPKRRPLKLKLIIQGHILATDPEARVRFPALTEKKKI